MAESAPGSSAQSRWRDRAHLATSEYASPEKLRARWRLYGDGVPAIKAHAVARLGLGGDEDVLEVGCGEGDVLLGLRAGGHRGRLVGVDLSGGMFAQAQAAQELATAAAVEFHARCASELPFLDRSFDVVLAFFMVHHMPDIDAALREWRRVLRPGGRFVAAAASRHERPRFHVHRRRLAEELSRPPLARMSDPFDLEGAEELLRPHFAIQETHVSERQLELPDAESYLAGLSSVRAQFEPAPSESEWTRALKLVRAEIEREWSGSGAPGELSRLGYVLCSA
jgi:ubiquinone/menaquinone biosynthesis C-methylase UbiE